MSNTDKTSDKRQSPVKLIQFAILAFILLMLVAGVIIVAPLVSGTMSRVGYRADFQKGTALFWTDQKAAEQFMKKAIADADAANASIVDKMKLRQDYADYLYGADDWERANELVQSSLNLSPGDPPPHSEQAKLVIDGYQARGRKAHELHLKDRTKPDGDKDCEKSVEISVKAFGPDGEQTMYMITELAKIYADQNRTAKANELIDRAVKSIDTDKDVKKCADFIYKADSRIKGVQHDYRGAIKSYLLAKACSTPDDRDNVWEEFSEGIKLGTKNVPSQVDQALAMFNERKYAQLDKLAEQLRNSQAEEWNGTWVLDSFYEKIIDDKNMKYDTDYAQKLHELKVWLTQTNSTTARVALAAGYKDYAWFARGTGYADSVKSSDWQHFGSRVAKCKATLDADPTIKNKCPVACRMYSAVATGEGWNPNTYRNFLEQCHARWPKYLTIDRYACNYLLPRWFGKPGDTEEFIEARANATKGSKGDERYAQLVDAEKNYIDDLFQPGTPLQWARVKKGFKQIFIDFPNSPDARLAYIQLAEKAHDTQAVNSAFDGYKPN